MVSDRVNESFAIKGLAAPVYFVPFLLGLLFSVMIYFLFHYTWGWEDKWSVVIMGIWICLFLIFWIPFIFPLPHSVGNHPSTYTRFWKFYLQYALEDGYSLFYLLFGVYLNLAFRMLFIKIPALKRAGAELCKYSAEIQGRYFTTNLARFQNWYLICAPVLIFLTCSIGKRCNDFLFKSMMAQFNPFPPQVVPFFLTMIFGVLLFPLIQRWPFYKTCRTNVILMIWIFILTVICIPLVFYCFVYQPLMFSAGGWRGPSYLYFLHADYLTSSYWLLFVVYGVYICFAVSSFRQYVLRAHQK